MQRHPLRKACPPEESRSDVNFHTKVSRRRVSNVCRAFSKGRRDASDRPRASGDWNTDRARSNFKKNWTLRKTGKRLCSNMTISCLSSPRDKSVSSFPPGLSDIRPRPKKGPERTLPRPRYRRASSQRYRPTVLSPVADGSTFVRDAASGSVVCGRNQSGIATSWSMSMTSTMSMAISLRVRSTGSPCSKYTFKMEKLRI